MTPRARRLAAELGVDPGSLDHDGPITADTVLQAATPSAPVDRSLRMRAAIAALMEQSWREIPHYHVSQELDITELSSRIETMNDERPLAERVVLAAALDVAIARAALDTPDMNGWWRDGRFVAADRVDLGLIVSLRTGGIVAPTIVDAGSLDIDRMMATLADLVARSRRGRLRERDLQPASISITNMGERGADAVAGIIYPPQVALIGLGAPRTVVRLVDGAVTPRTVVEATVAGDHRAHDGLAAARFLRSVAQHLEELP